MKMTSVHCSKVATIYEEEKPPPSRRAERDGTRDYTFPALASSHDTSLNGSLCPCNFLPRSRERRASEGNPDFPSAANQTLPTSSSSLSSLSTFLSLYLTSNENVR